VIATIAIAAELIGHRLNSPNGQSPFAWTLHTMLRDGLILTVLFLLVRALLSGRLRLPFRRPDRSRVPRVLPRRALGHSRPRARRHDPRPPTLR
jgi:hypothetical protein